MGLSDHTLRWPRPRRSFGPVCAHATSTVGPAMLSVASTHTEPKSSAIIAATGEKCGLACGSRGGPGLLFTRRNALVDQHGLVLALDHALVDHDLGHAPG